MNNHSTPVQGKRPEKRDLSTSCIDIETESKKIKSLTLTSCRIVKSSTKSNLSRRTWSASPKKMHALFKSDLDDMVRSVVQAFIPQVITGINASLNDIIESLTQENTHLKNQLAGVMCEADRAEQYSRRNCQRMTGIPEARDEDTDNIIVTMAKDLGAELSIAATAKDRQNTPVKRPGTLLSSLFHTEPGKNFTV
ncbi:hypothetical protein DPMN_090983 [Dreissena polymorpha]|uniref:Uncharacterized protein n=1 Tax=Dreissena polymorpha TaxID=45954 RepID=A0A9D4KZN2_DREPO|nr:hypothetical protein DPMN_090983 [Dreissena polymorpha]